MLTAVLFGLLGLLAVVPSGAATAAEGPAPDPVTRAVIADVHTDAISTFWDDGHLVLASKADVPESHTRYEAEDVWFHVDGDALIEGLPAGYEFIAPEGATIWLAPEVQQEGVIWPGFSTESVPAGTLDGDDTTLTLVDVDGPGSLELFDTEINGDPHRLWSSDDAGFKSFTRKNVHMHANWAFTATGTYHLTVKADAAVGGVPVSDTAVYTFVVGDLPAQASTSTTLTASATELASGDPLTLTAAVLPSDVAGYVEFRDGTTLLGHDALAAGAAQLQVTNLGVGSHSITATFVPETTNLAAASASEPVTATVTGEGPSELRPIVLDDGHIDLFELTYDQAAEQLDLNVKDDTTLYDFNVEYRDPETVTVAVDQELAGFQIDELPPGYEFLAPAGRPLYFLDWTQQEGLPWPGWSTERLAASLPEGMEIPHKGGSVEFAVDVAGPGDVFVFSLGGGPSGDQPQDRFIDTTDDQPDVIQSLPGSHYHTNWVFTEVGDYELTVTPSATTTTGETLAGPPRSYHFHVGPRPDVPHRVSAEEFGASISGVPATVGEDTEVNLALELSQPHPELAGYQWYRWIDGQGEVKIPGATTAQLTTTVDPYDSIYAAMLDSTGRMLSFAYASFQPVPSVPGAPANPSAWVETNGRDVTLSWGTPSSHNSPLTGYVATLTSSAGTVLSQEVAGGDAYEATFADVPAGTWTGTVHAINGIGAGPESGPSSPVTVLAPDLIAVATTVRASPIAQAYGKTAKLAVTVAPGATGTVQVKAGSRTVAATLVAGKASVTLPAKALAPGRRTVSISYAGVAGQFLPSTGQASINVVKARPVVNVRRARATVRRGRVATFHVAVSASGVKPTGSVTVRVAGRSKKVRLNANGRATVRITVPRSTRPGQKAVVVTYLGDALVAKGTARTRIRATR